MFFLDIDCSSIGPIIKFIKLIFLIFEFVLPIGLIIMGAWDLGKAVFSSDDKEIKAATGKLIKRAIAAVSIFFLVFVVNLLIDMVGESNGDSPLKCWDQV